jgi:WD repeat-containing protein 24
MSCGRCGKPILPQQVGSMCANCRSPAARCSIWFVPFSLLPILTKKHHFLKIKNHVPPTSHLPVKSMLFHCTVCSHGGHQACYRRFYAEMPMIVLPTPHPPSPPSPLIKQPVPPPPPDRSASRSKDRGGDDVADIVLDHSIDASTIVPPAPRQLMGHSCAAGCGHVCWVANFRDEAEKV